MKNKISRRDFVKLTLASLGAAFLAACERAAKPVTKILPTLTAKPSETNTPPPTGTNTPQATATETQTPTPTEIPCFHLLTPENGAKLKALGKAIFAWEAMPGAVKYKLEIILPLNQSVVFETDATGRNQYLEAFQPGGKYQWKVSALDVNGMEICTAEPFTFEKPEYIPPAPTKKSNNGGDDSNGDGSDGNGQPESPPPPPPGYTDTGPD